MKTQPEKKDPTDDLNSVNIKLSKQLSLWLAFIGVFGIGFKLLFL